MRFLALISSVHRLLIRRYFEGLLVRATLENRITNQEGGHATQSSDEQATAEPHPFSVFLPPALVLVAAASVASCGPHLGMRPVIALGMVWHVVLLAWVIIVRLTVGIDEWSLRVALLVASLQDAHR